MLSIFSKIAAWLAWNEQNQPLPQSTLPWISVLEIVSKVTQRAGFLFEAGPHTIPGSSHTTLVRDSKNTTYQVRVLRVTSEARSDFYALKVEQIIMAASFPWLDVSEHERTIANILIHSKWGNSSVIDSGLPTSRYRAYSLAKYPEYIPRGMLYVKPDDVAIVRTDGLFGIPQRVYPFTK